MPNETLIPDPVNPLQGLVRPAHFPNTIRVPTDASMSVDSNDLDSLHNLMKSLEMENPGNALEESRAVVDNDTELLNTKFTSFLQSMDIDGDVGMKGKEKLQQRRPGLGRKRPVFTLKSSTSQHPIPLGPRSDIDQLTDPAEFFAAAERLEEAEKEIMRQSGISTHDIDFNNPPPITRLRRPGILGKTVRDKHRFSFAQSDDDASMVSQESPGHDILAGHNFQLPQENPGLNVDLLEEDFTGSIEITENRIDGILDELLSSSAEDLEGDRVISRLQERLQIKPIELGTLILPDFPMTGKTDGKAIGERIQKPKMFSFDFEIQNLVKRTTEGSPSTERQHGESAANIIASPTPAKSPFASLSLLKKRILQSNPLRDPFSPLNIDLQSEDTPDSSMKMNLECLSNNVVSTESHGETENVAGRDNTNMDPLGGSDFSPKQLMEKNSGRDSVKTVPSESQFGVEQRNCHDDIDANIEVNLNTRYMDCHHESDGEDQMNPAAVEVHSRENRSELPEMSPQRHAQAKDKQQKAKRYAGERRERKALKPRPSLADAGTSFEDGVRRSKRTKTRPLEFWKGERLLFGRVNESVKLVGVKYLSPAQGSLKVKSYISDDYKEVVDLAARY